MDKVETLRYNLKRIRKSVLDLTQAEMADSIGEKRTTYARYELDITPPQDVVDKIAKRHKMDYVDFLKASVSGETAASYYNKFKQFIEKAHGDKFCEYNIGSFRPRFRKDKSRLKKDYLLAVELQKLNNTSNDHTEAGHAFIFGCLTGIRPQDIRTLYGRDIRNGRFLRRQSKTENVLEVNLSATALAIYKKYYRGENKLLFPNIPKTSEGWNKFLERWTSAAKINKHITTYCARHSFCMMLLEQKVEWRSIIDHMGWSEDNGMKMLFVYTRALEKHMADAANTLPQLTI